MLVRDATDADLEPIADIYNDVVRTSTAVWSESEADLEERRSWLAERQPDPYAVLVAVEGKAVVGFGSLGRFRPASGYRTTVEHSVHVHSDHRGAGVGRALLGALIERASANGAHAIIGGVDAANRASLRLHESLGFERVGTLPQVGRKFDRWLDLVFVQRLLPEDQGDTVDEVGSHSAGSPGGTSPG